MKNISIEYAHIYTNKNVGEEQRLSLDILREVTKGYDKGDVSLVVMVDDYSFPDPSFDYSDFTGWLGEEGFAPQVVLRESQLIPACDEVLKLIEDEKLREQVSDYIRAKKYPCSLFIATWYLIRLGHLESNIFSRDAVSLKLLNILPVSFKPFEDMALDIISKTKFRDAIGQIENRYFEGRLLA